MSEIPTKKRAESPSNLGNKIDYKIAKSAVPNLRNGVHILGKSVPAACLDDMPDVSILADSMHNFQKVSI